MAKKRARKPREPQIVVQEEREGSTEDAFNDLLGEPPQEPNKEPEQLVISSGESTSIDDYVRTQVLQEMYGTDTPSAYDKISLAIKRKL